MSSQTAEASDFVLSFRSLRRSFKGKSGAIVALDDVSASIPRSVFFGLVGPNGAGKTTLMRALSGLSAPDSGEIEICGRAVWPSPDSIRQLVGVLPDDLHLFERLTGRELLSYVGSLRGIERQNLETRSDELLEIFGFGRAADELVADYSTGMRKKVGLAAALIHTPRVLLLDEPFESVDPVSARVLQDVLKAYQRSGGTIVLSSHVMDTVQDLCSHLLVLNGGRVIMSGTVDEVAGRGRLEDVFLDAIAGGHQTRKLDWFQREIVEMAL